MTLLSRCLSYVERRVRPPLRQLLVLSSRRNRQRWRDIASSPLPAASAVHVSYGHDHVPLPGEPAQGGMVKFQRMLALYPNSPRRFNVLYLGSSSLPADWRQLLEIARRKGALIAWNQNGVAYPGWHGRGWERTNAPMKQGIHAADYVFYQSEFCKRSADQFLGRRTGPSEILYNAVDTEFFTPGPAGVQGKAAKRDSDDLVLLLGGSQYAYYRIECAVKTLAALTGHLPARLIVTGPLSWIRNHRRASQKVLALAEELGVVDRIQFMGSYLQQDAPSIFRQADILLHTKYNDPCPSVVVEAMACGLPVVFSGSGGMPELVGEAGVGVPTEQSWERDLPPDPDHLAAAVLRVAERRQEYSTRARQRAVEKFDIGPWLESHRQVFTELLSCGKRSSAAA